MELEKMEKLEMGDARKGRYSGWWNPNHQAKLRLTLNYICVCVKMCFMLTVLWNGCYLVLAFPVLGFLNLTLHRPSNTSLISIRLFSNPRRLFALVL